MIRYLEQKLPTSNELKKQPLITQTELKLEKVEKFRLTQLADPKKTSNIIYKDPHFTAKLKLMKFLEAQNWLRKTPKSRQRIIAEIRLPENSYGFVADTWIPTQCKCAGRLNSKIQDLNFRVFFFLIVLLN